MEISKKNPLLGAHMSIAGGVKNALTAGESIGCTAIQIFTANNRQWSLKTLEKNEAAEYLAYKNHTPIKVVVSHASYLINLGSPKAEVVEKSKKCLEAEIERCNQLSIPYTIIHPGAHLKSDEEECLTRIADNLADVLEKTSTCMVLLENTAGQGTNMGYTFEQLAVILKKIKKHRNRVGICFDTCHACAAGYTFATPTSYKAMWDEFDTIVGINNLKVIHLNDSAKACGSRVDRHTHIGEGNVGLEAFKLIMNDKNFLHIPKILETPKEKGLEEDIQNLKTLRELIE